MSKFSLEFRESVKTGGNRLGQLIENPYKNFSASKMSNSVKPLTVVEYTDLMGKVHRIKCANRTQMKEAMLFLSIFKKEAASIKGIISEYPISFGRIPKRFMNPLRMKFGKYPVLVSSLNTL